MLSRHGRTLTRLRLAGEHKDAMQALISERIKDAQQQQPPHAQANPAATAAPASPAGTATPLDGDTRMVATMERLCREQAEQASKREREEEMRGLREQMEDRHNQLADRHADQIAGMQSKMDAFSGAKGPSPAVGLPPPMSNPAAQIDVVVQLQKEKSEAEQKILAQIHHAQDEKQRQTQVCMPAAWVGEVFA